MKAETAQLESFEEWMYGKPLVPGGVKTALAVACGQKRMVSVCFGSVMPGCDLYVNPTRRSPATRETLKNYRWPVSHCVVEIITNGPMRYRDLRTLIRCILLSNADLVIVNDAMFFPLELDKFDALTATEFAKLVGRGAGTSEEDSARAAPADQRARHTAE